MVNQQFKERRSTVGRTIPGQRDLRAPEGRHPDEPGFVNPVLLSRDGHIRSTLSRSKGVSLEGFDENLR